MLIGLYGGGRNILPWPGAEILESKVVGLVMPGDEIVRRFDLGGNARAVVGTSCFHKLCAAAAKPSAKVADECGTQFVLDY
jgi:hypothetical protein